MTTPPPIPPEAMDGRECLVWIQGNSTPAIGVYCGLLEGWFVDRANVAREVVFLAIPISWCLAAPGMREVLLRISTDDFLEHDIGGTIGIIRCIATQSAAACDGKGE